MSTLTEDIRQKAQELGFSKIGFAKIERLKERSHNLQKWLARGFHGSMGWMVKNIEERIDPRTIMLDAKSVISVAINYFNKITYSEDEHTGKISRHAIGDDYHLVLKERLQNLLKFIKHVERSIEGKIYVDSGPIMEKAWAERSGIGWQGKHTVVITKEYGSWVFLGEIILNKELDYDTPANDLCGDCTLCIEACPTQAIIEPYVLDANRCISYLTIEHIGEIKQEYAEKFNNWIYGCDICQEVCPWNQKYSQPTHLKEFHPRKIYIQPKLESLLKLTENEFKLKFKNNPIERIKLSKFKRNVEEVLIQQSK